MKDNKSEKSKGFNRCDFTGPGEGFKNWYFQCRVDKFENHCITEGLCPAKYGYQ